MIIFTAFFIFASVSADVFVPVHMCGEGAPCGNEKLPETLKIADIELNPGERRVKRSGRDVPLTLKEFGLLEYFMRHPNQVVNREDLLNHLWDFNYVGFSNVVDVHVKNLRRKLDANGESILETVRGIGYRLAE